MNMATESSHVQRSNSQGSLLKLVRSKSMAYTNFSGVNYIATRDLSGIKCFFPPYFFLRNTAVGTKYIVAAFPGKAQAKV